MATHSSTLAWKIPWAEESGRLSSMGSRRARHDLATSFLGPQLVIKPVPRAMELQSSNHWTARQFTVFSTLNVH